MTLCHHQSSSGKASQAEFQGELAKALHSTYTIYSTTTTMPVNGWWSGICSLIPSTGSKSSSSDEYDRSSRIDQSCLGRFSSSCLSSSPCIAAPPPTLALAEHFQRRIAANLCYAWPARSWGGLETSSCMCSVYKYICSGMRILLWRLATKMILYTKPMQ